MAGEVGIAIFKIIVIGQGLRMAAMGVSEGEQQPAADMMASDVPSRRPHPSLYWLGNAAKARVINEILRDAQEGALVFDYGAGRGGDWPRVLEARPDLKLICFEPDTAAAAELRQCLHGVDARVLSDSDFAAADFAADYITSFSVLEHVADRPAYMAHAKRLLARHGTFYLNYDDGHFRTTIDLDEFRGWPANLAATFQNRAAAIWPKIGRPGLYQSRVSARAIDGLVRAADFQVTEDRYENLLAMKNLAKTIPDELRQEFTRFWLGIEAELNARFRVTGEARMQDTVNLWREMASRTLTLRHV